MGCPLPPYSPRSSFFSFAKDHSHPLSPLALSPHTNASSGIQNVTKKLKDPELTQKVTASAAWGWGAISTQAGTLWSKAAETVGAIGEG